IPPPSRHPSQGVPRPPAPHYVHFSHNSSVKDHFSFKIIGLYLFYRLIFNKRSRMDKNKIVTVKER
ncbi:MAG: hypothetical protein AB2591_19415, partial [Candidatus Thiodiazotropha sp.]